MFDQPEKQLKVIERGTVDIFPREELIRKLQRSRDQNRPLRIKLGVDPTVADLHLGHAVPLYKLRDFQRLGHLAVFIIGDYTAMVGDPSGQDRTRPQLTHEEVLESAKTYVEQVGKILDLERTEIRYNGEWFSKMGFQDVIRLAAGCTVARLLDRDDFGKRYKAGSPISLHELLYPLMQGYDSVMVNSDVEIGATEQTFNLLVGRDQQRNAGTEPQVALTLPILVGTDGVRKMSKSLRNYIGITDPPEEIYGKVMSIPDDAMRGYFELATDVPLDTVADLLGPDGDRMQAKLMLARSIVERYHGKDAAQEAAARFDRTVRNRELPEDVPEITLGARDLKDGKIWIVRLVVKCGFAESNGEARRLVGEGGVSIDGIARKDPGLDLEPRSGMILKVGKRRVARITMEGARAS